MFKTFLVALTFTGKYFSGKPQVGIDDMRRIVLWNDGILIPPILVNQMDTHCCTLKKSFQKAMIP